MRRQTTRHILMVRPARFGFNQETAADNVFQAQESRLSPEQISDNALDEFNQFVRKLKGAGVHIIVAPDSVHPVKTDAIFPNNWVTFHQEGYVVTYPMLSPGRRRERRRKIINIVLSKGFKAVKNINLAFNEKIGKFLEGTGSVVFDHVHRIAYASVSPRTEVGLLHELCELIGYRPAVFHATDAQNRAIYHTNVMMSVGETFAVVCLDAVRDAAERAMLEGHFSATGKEMVAISVEQMNAFAGNILQVRGEDDQHILVMSTQAHQALRDDQIERLEKHSRLLHSAIPTIERCGGGSARCMMAEIFLPEEEA